MNLKNPKTQRIYSVESGEAAISEMGENLTWYAHLSLDPEGDAFMKVCEYGKEEDTRRRESLQRMFSEEADTLKRVRLCSDRVPALIDAWDDRKEKRYVLIMEKLPGMTLRQWMNSYPLTKVDDTSLYVRAQIVIGLADILQRIGAKIPSMVHRDLKPENIFIAFENGKWTPYITDFGCAQLNFIRGVGTRFYQSPEQTLRGAAPRITSKADVFSLGLIFYELLTGSVPRIGVDFVQTIGSPVWKRTPSLPEAILKHPKGPLFGQVLEKMTLFDPLRRADYNEIKSRLNFKLRSKPWKKP